MMFIKIAQKRWITASLLAGALLLGACGDDDDDNGGGNEPPDTTRGNAVLVLTADNHLLTVDENSPGTADADVTITGLAVGETLHAIDVRPNNGRLYGLATDGASARIYHIDVRDGTATAVGAPFQYATADGTAVPVTGSDIDMDFNPSVDRIRIVTRDGLNARANPNTGGPVDGDLGGASGSAGGINTDGSTAAQIGGAAYTNNTFNVTATSLYTVRFDGTSLAIQNPPNAGVQVAVGAITVGGAAIEAGTRVAFDIARGVDTAMANAAVASGSGYLAVVRGSVSQLYRIDLTNAQATSLGSFGVEVRDVAVWTPASVGIAHTEPAGLPLLSRFALDNPTQATTVSVTGLAAGEALAGVAIRPATGQLVGLGYSEAADTASFYIVDPQTGAATVVGGAPGAVFLVDVAGNPVALEELHIAVNNTADRIRVVSSSGLNFRVNPATGLAVDGDLGGPQGLVGGTNPDGAISGAVARADAVAYLDRSPTADLFIIADSASDSLASSETPNTGVVSAIGPVGVDFAGFTALADGAAGSFYGAFQDGGVTSLYTINAATGAATSAGSIGTGANPVRSLVTAVVSTTAAQLTRP